MGLVYRKNQLKEVVKKEWNYTLYEGPDDDLIFTCFCGNLGLYTIDFALNEAEQLQYEREGIAFLERLAASVRADEDNYLPRQVTTD